MKTMKTMKTMKIMRKVIAWDLKFIKKLVFILIISMMAISTTCILILKILPKIVNPAIIMQISEYSTQVIVGILIMTLVINIFIKELSRHTLLELLDLSKLKIMLFRFVEVFALTLIISTIGVICVSMVDFVFLADFNAVRNATNMIFSCFTMVGRPILTWLYPISIAVCACFLLSVSFMFAGIFNMTKNRLKGSILAVTCVLVFAFAYLAISFYIADYLSYVFSISRFEKHLFFNLVGVATTWGESSPLYLFSFNIFNYLMDIYIILATSFCSAVYLLGKGEKV